MSYRSRLCDESVQLSLFTFLTRQIGGGLNSSIVWSLKHQFKFILLIRDMNISEFQAQVLNDLPLNILDQK